VLSGLDIEAGQQIDRRWVFNHASFELPEIVLVETSSQEIHSDGWSSEEAKLHLYKNTSIVSKDDSKCVQQSTNNKYKILSLGSRLVPWLQQVLSFRSLWCSIWTTLFGLFGVRL